MGIINDAQQPVAGNNQVGASPPPPPPGVPTPGDNAGQSKAYNKDAATAAAPAQPYLLSPEQAQLEGRKLVAKAKIILHQQGTFDQVIKLLELKGSRPEQLVAHVCVMLIQLLDATARKEKVEIDDRAHVYGAYGLCAEIGDLAKEQHIFTLSGLQLGLAIGLTIQDYLKGEIAAGRIDKDALAADFYKAIRMMPHKEQMSIHQQMLQINKTAMGPAKARKRKRNRLSMGRA